jgi:hypothetical protein
MSVLTDILIWILRHLPLVVGTLSFLAGFALIPFLGMVSMGALPAILAEPLASNLWKVALSGVGGGRLHQLPTDEYELRARSGDEDPANFWSRIVGRPFGVSYERTEAAFRNRVEQIDPDALVTDGGDSKSGLPGKRERRSIERGGVGTFLDTSQDPGLFVRVGEKLAALKDTDGLQHVNVAEDQTMRDEAGDTGMETKWRVIFWLGMTFFGTVAGVGVFFVL